MKKVSLVWVAVLLAACAKPYVQPAGTETASLKLVNTASSNVGLMGFNVADGCSGGKLHFNGKRHLSMGEETTVRVKANQPFSFAFLFNVGNKYCNMPATFIPQEGKNYVAKFAADSLKCYVGVALVDGANEKRDPTFKLRQWRTPMWEDGAFCE